VRAFPLGAIGAISRFFLENGVSEAFMAGGVRRDAWGSLRPDRHALPLLPSALFGGDDAVLRGVARCFARQGVEIGDPAPFLAELIAAEGLLAGPAPEPGTLEELERARSAALSHGAMDRGQAVVSYKGRIAGREGRGGTDALLAAAPGPGAVLVKVVKPGQDRRFDLPAIGPSTIMVGARVRLRAIGVEAGGVLLLERGRVRELCGRAGMTLYGLPAGGEPGLLAGTSCDNMPARRCER
jgi:DUF1009 family protein